MNDPEDELELREVDYARMLVARLERLSVDSYWAHRSSGLRGSLLRALEQVEGGAGNAEDLRQRLGILIQQGSALLARAARELRGDETRR